MSAQQIADAKLPGLPRDKRKVNEIARQQRWHQRISADGLALVRSRAGRGGGIEFHCDVLPEAARAKLTQTSLTGPGPSPSPEGVGSIWDGFDRQSAKVKAEARRRLGIMDAVAAAESAGLTKSAAVTAVGSRYAVSPATIWNWWSLLVGVPHADRLPALAPKRSGGGKETAVDEELFRLICSDYLRPEGPPTWSSCYRRLVRDHCTPIGLTAPTSRTLFRKMEREIDPLVIVKRRSGRDAHERTLPSQIRDVSHLNALDIVNVDGHRWDDFVTWHDGRIIRPMMVAIQDVYSGKFLAWRIDDSENSVATRLAFYDLFRIHGIPKKCLLDNGRAFASKKVTGGAKTRYRFKIKDDEPLGFLPALGIQISWATPYHGQAKPIERMFRNMCDTVATHPAFAGAYTGNKVTNKPENYGSKAIPIAKFMQLLAREIDAYNAQLDRRGEVMKGRPADRRSFDLVYADSVAVNPVGKATPAQLRLAMLEAADQIKTHKDHGSISIHGNRYWSEELSRRAGERVTVRFDPDNLHSAIDVYTPSGKFICSCPLWEKSGFDSVEEAAKAARRKSDWRKKTKAADAALELYSAAEVAAFYDKHQPPEADVPEVSVIRPVRPRAHGRSQGSAALKLEPSQLPLRSTEETPKPAVIDRLAAIAERQLRIVE